MVHVVARIAVKVGNRSVLIDAIRDLLPQVRAEAGCVSYAPSIDAPTDIERQAPAEDNVVTVIEQWQSVEHLKAHLAAVHMSQFRAKAGDLVESVELRILQPV